MDDEALRDYLAESMRLCALALPKSVQVQLGFLPSITKKEKQRG
jgi:hypothetical protein